MKIARSRLLLRLFYLALLFNPVLLGGGPNVVEEGGLVYRWDNSVPVPYAIDQGSLGSLSEEDSLALVRQSIERWDEISSARVDFEEGERLEINIDSSNYRAYFGIGQQEQFLRPENPIIFDDSGEIIEDYLGQGSSTAVLGFSGIRFADDSRRLFLSSWVVINGAQFNSFADLEEAGKVITHELGHLLGLDHSQGLPENFTEPVWGGEVPLMYPIVGLNAPDGPIQDDIAWLSWLYPSPGFLAQENSGTIRGRVVRPSGDPLLGANVFARKVEDGTPLRSDITSVASGFLRYGEGEFELPGLEPGEYVIALEPLNPVFTGGSGIGPYEVRPANFPRDYFDSSESSSEDPSEQTILQVAAGDTLDAIVLVSNEEPRMASSLSDDDEILYRFPEGFTFPFFGKAYRSAYLCSDGILSFKEGEHPDGNPRSVDRFLGGPPRIAPLYTDLNPAVFTALIRIEESQDGDSISFAWNQVPEYSGSVPQGSNSFSVTLHRNGDILFEYDEIALTPDPDELFPEGLNAVVGITPGGDPAAASVDLSASAFHDAEGMRSIYEAFRGESFDLGNSSIGFNAAEAQLLFPFVLASENDFTGYALTNYGDSAAGLQFEARDGQGRLTAEFPFNPSSFQLPEAEQFALLAREVFGAEPESFGDLARSWVRVLSAEPELGSFAQIGNGMGVRQTRMDGAVAFTGPSNQLFFTRIYSGQESYPISSGMELAPAETWIALANPAGQQVDLVLSLHGADGELLVPEAEIQLDPLGGYVSSLSEIFEGLAGGISQGYLAIEADGKGVAGFEMIELEDTLIGLNAAVPTSNRVLYSAQLASHETIFTSIKVINPTDRAISFSLKAYLVEEDTTITEVTTPLLTLGPSQSLQEDVDGLFGLEHDPGRIITGSLKLVGSEAGLVGDVVFGDPRNASYAAALPLQDRLFTDAIQSHISNGIYPGDASRNAFTGLAVFNPGVIRAEVRISAYDPEGNLVGEAYRDLDPGSRFALTLLELIPETGGMSGGFVRLRSGQPVVAQQLFGNAVLDYMSAVPPAIVE